jgi:hypothetical protein
MFKEATTMKKHYGSFRELLRVTRRTLIMGWIGKTAQFRGLHIERKNREERVSNTRSSILQKG